jgi:hypothetical protein
MLVLNSILYCVQKRGDKTPLSKTTEKNRESAEIVCNLIKGIDRSFELRCEIRLNRFVMTNWRLGNFFYFILKGQHHKISKKLIDAA